MVNLRGGLRGLGQAFTFLGQQGLENQRRQEADTRLLAREQAMARFSQNIRREDQDEGVKRELGEFEAQTPLVAERAGATTKANLEQQEPVREREFERTEQAQLNRENRGEQRDIREETRAEARARRTEARAASREEAEERRRLDREGDAVIDRFTNEEGYRVLVTRSGEEVTLTNRVRESGGDDFDLGEDAPPTPRRPTLTPRPTGRQQQTRMVPVGSIVRDEQGRRYRMGPNGERIPLDR